MSALPLLPPLRRLPSLLPPPARVHRLLGGHQPACLIAIADANKEPTKPRRLRFQCEEEYHFDHAHDSSLPSSATVVWDVLEHVCGCDMDRCPIPACAEVKADILHCTTCCAKRLLLSFA